MRDRYKERGPDIESERGLDSEDSGGERRKCGVRSERQRGHHQ